MTKHQKLISDLHYPLWLLKDFMWMAGLPIISLILAIPTIIISIYITIITGGKQQNENKIILSWLSANTMWMCDEQFGWNCRWVAYILFGIGLIQLLFYIPYLLGKKGNGTN
jgi:uncharacterized membrane protein